MSKETQLIVYIILLMIAGTIIPLPATAGILLFVVLKQPDWFRKLYHQVYK